MKTIKIDITRNTILALKSAAERLESCVECCDCSGQKPDGNKTCYACIAEAGYAKALRELLKQMT